MSQVRSYTAFARVIVTRDAEELAEVAADLFRDRVTSRPDLAIAVPAGRTPRRMYARMAALQASRPVDYSNIRIFAVDELCPPAPDDGYFWRQVRKEFLAWANVDHARCRPFSVADADLDAMCLAYEDALQAAGGLDVLMLGLGPNAHLASNEPGADFASRTRRVRLLDATVSYILTDDGRASRAPVAEGNDLTQDEVCERAVTLGLATIMEAREVVVLVSGEAKREALSRMLDGPVTTEVPASMLQSHPRCVVIADRAARPDHRCR
jgi:glucosamine-6-phosphate deaminase